MEAVNPYQAPEGELLKETDAVGDIKFFSPGCRIGRLRYFSHYSLFTLGCYVALAVFGVIAALLGDGASVIVGVMGVLMGIAAMVVGFIMVAQRLHDLNRSGWFMLLFLIPLINIVVMLYVFFWPGTAGQNDYGPQPPANKLWHWIVGLILPIAMTGIIAAVALPAYQDYVERAQQAQAQQ
jgi:uncharacterized membrane protein YhaH (DUF805 family)